MEGWSLQAHFKACLLFFSKKHLGTGSFFITSFKTVFISGCPEGEAASSPCLPSLVPRGATAKSSPRTAAGRGRRCPCPALRCVLRLVLELSSQHRLGNVRQRQELPWPGQGVRTALGAPAAAMPWGMQPWSCAVRVLSPRSQLAGQRATRRSRKGEQVPPRPGLLEMEILPCSQEISLLQASKSCFSRTQTAKFLQQDPECSVALGTEAQWVAPTRAAGRP